MQMRAGGAPRPADCANRLTTLDGVASIHRHRLQMEVHTDKTVAMIDVHRISGEELIGSEDHSPCSHGLDVAALAVAPSDLKAVMTPQTRSETRSRAMECTFELRRHSRGIALGSLYGNTTTSNLTSRERADAHCANGPISPNRVRARIPGCLYCMDLTTIPV